MSPLTSLGEKFRAFGVLISGGHNLSMALCIDSLAASWISQSIVYNQRVIPDHVRRNIPFLS
jgi:hypothetical protein